MSISVTEKHGRTATIYLLATVLTALFGAVYEKYSHEVYSYWMIYAFAFPLVAGAVPFQMLSLRPVKHDPPLPCRQMYHCGVATLTVGSIVEGILDIYGTTNALTGCYWLLGGVLLIAAVTAFSISLMRNA